MKCPSKLLMFAQPHRVRGLPLACKTLQTTLHAKDQKDIINIENRKAVLDHMLGMEMVFGSILSLSTRKVLR